MKTFVVRASAILLLFAGLSLAQSNVIFNNIVGPCAASPTQCFYVNIDGANAPQAPASVAAQFTPTMTGPAAGARVFVDSFLNGSPLFNIAIFSDAAGLPGLPLGQTSATAGTSGGIVMASFSQPVPLEADKPYWLVLTPGDVTTDVGWLNGGAALLPSAYTPSPAGSGWQKSGQLALQFAIDAAVELPTVTAVSAATYKIGAVAPNSLIAVFGTGLAPSATQGKLNSNGQLPTTLLGTNVEIAGKSAPLLFVSPTQINCVVPAISTIGPATISVYGSGVQVGSGTVSIAAAAPGLFSADESGTGEAIAANGVTYAGPPFSVETQQNPGTDKRTRIILWGTGMRYAGNPTMNPSISNVAGNVTINAWDASGKPVPVQPEYAGPAPGFFGLDQLNLVLPAAAGSTGMMSVQVYAGGAGSNTLQVPMLQSALPTVNSVQPANVAPGAIITIDGTGFVAEDPTLPAVRDAVYLLLPSGNQIGIPIIQTSTTELTAMVAPMQADHTWYQGTAKVCVSVDGQQSCAATPIQIGPLTMLNTPPGNLLLSIQQQLAAEIESYFMDAGLPAVAAAIQTGAQTDYSKLQTYIAAAVGGTPLTLPQPDGTSITVNPSIAVIKTMEALLANSAVLSSNSPSAHAKAQATAPTNCASSEEKMLLQQQGQYTALYPKAGIVTSAAGAATALANPFICASLSVYGCAVAELGSLGLTALGLTTVSGNLLWQVSPFWLSSLEVVPACAAPQDGCLNVPLASSENFSVYGDFQSKISAQSAVNIGAVNVVDESVARLATSAGIIESLSTIEKAAAGVIAGFAKDLGIRYGENFVTSPPLPNSLAQRVKLSAQSITVFPDEDLFASITLACGGTPASAYGKQLTGILGPSKFWLDVNTGAFLVQNTLPGATLSVTVSEPFTVTPSDDYSSTGPQGNISATPKAYTITNHETSPIAYTVSATYGNSITPWLSITPASGSLNAASSATVIVSTSAAANDLSNGTYTGKITFSNTSVSITRNATLTVTPLGACAEITGNWNGTETGSVTLAIATTTEGSGSETLPVSGSGSTTITQSGCSIQYEPIPETNLIPPDLTPSQLAMFVRTGSVSGNSISVTGILALIDTVAAEENGVTIGQVTSNIMTASGQLQGGDITLNETGRFEASGTYSNMGESGSFTLTVTSSSIATLTPGSTTSSVHRRVRATLVQILPDHDASSPALQHKLSDSIRAALSRVLVFAGP